MIGEPTNSTKVTSQPSSTSIMMLSSRTRLVEAISKAIAAVKFALCGKSTGPEPRLRKSTMTTPTRGRERSQSSRPVVWQEPTHLPMRDDSLHNAGQSEAEDQPPQDFPSEGRGLTLQQAQMKSKYYVAPGACGLQQGV